MQQPTLLLTLLLYAALGAAPLGAHEDKQSLDAKLVPVMEQALSDWPDHQVTMLHVSYPPGGFSAPHRHAGAHTFVYVLQGALEMGVAGGEPVVLKAGDPFYESPTDVHNVSRNASADEAAEFLVFFVHPSGIPLVTPADNH